MNKNSNTRRLLGTRCAPVNNQLAIGKKKKKTLNKWGALQKAYLRQRTKEALCEMFITRNASGASYRDGHQRAHSGNTQAW